MTAALVLLVVWIAVAAYTVSENRRRTPRALPAHDRAVDITIVPGVDDPLTKMADVRATIRVRPGLRVAFRTRWDERAMAGLPVELWDMPLAPIDGVQVRTDRPDALAALPELVDGLRAFRRHDRVLFASDGQRVVARVEGSDVDLADAARRLERLVLLVVAWDDGLSNLLASLPEASPRVVGALDPAVVLAPDDLRIGVANGTQLTAILDLPEGAPAEIDDAGRAYLARAGDGDLAIDGVTARYTWRGIERDPDHLLAAVALLRRLRGATGPYR